MLLTLSRQGFIGIGLKGHQTDLFQSYIHGLCKFKSVHFSRALRYIDGREYQNFT